MIQRPLFKAGKYLLARYYADKCIGLKSLILFIVGVGIIALGYLLYSFIETITIFNS